MRVGGLHFWFMVLLGVMMLPRGVHAAVDVTLQAMQASVAPGDTFSVQVVLTAPTGPELISAVQVIFGWDTDYLTLIGHSQTGAVPLLASGFPPGDPYGINSGFSPPQTSPGFYQAYAQLGNPFGVDASGSLLTTFIFEAIQPTAITMIDILPAAGSPVGNTIVFDGVSANTNITGLLTGTSITIIPTPSGLLLLASGILVRTRRRGTT